jgi:uncharacterized protein (DUF2062 family)
VDNQNQLQTEASFFRRKFVKPFLKFLKQGVTPQQLALSVTLGIIVGVLPVLGVTTIICTIIAFSFRLNMLAIQLANQLVYPIQLLLFIPFIKAGEYFFNVPGKELTFDKVFTLFEQDWYLAIQQLWFANLLGVLIWTLASLPAFFLIYYVSKQGFQKIAPSV